MPLAFLPHQDVWEEDELESDYPFGISSTRTEHLRKRSV